MNWYKVASKKTAVEIGHGDTLHGQMMQDELKRLAKEVSGFRTTAAAGGPDDVLPRWRPDVRHKMLLLPSLAAVSRMSMGELDQLSKRMDDIRKDMKRYSIVNVSRFMGNIDGDSGRNRITERKP